MALRGLRVKKRFLPAVFKPPGSFESVLTIRGVREFTVDDPERIAVYMIDELAFAPPRLTLKAEPSCTVTFEVSELHVEAELRAVAYEWSSPGATALVIPFRAAEPVIGEPRREHTPSGKEGMPAHATILAPFVHSSRLDQFDRHRLRDTIRRFPAFDLRLASFGLFEHIGCLYLEPRPWEPFVRLSEALLDVYPEIEYPPEGAEAIVAHVTIGSGLTPEQQDELKREVAPRLPIRTRADRVVLYERAQDRKWQAHQSFALS